MRLPDKEIFFEALDLASPQEQARYLDDACANDPAQRQRLKEMIARAVGENPFMKEPATRSPPIILPVAADVVGARIGPYKLREKLGEGGFGAVYVADQLLPVKRRVALKIIKLGMDTREVVARFETERQALAMLDHPNIAKVFEAGSTDNGRPYFAMELVCGVRITQFCEENNLTTVERLKLFCLVCDAIQHAHQKGIIHRDIKPSNIMVTLHDGVPVPKVIDFGIAKATAGDLTDKTIYTQFQQFIGTPAYISPEQAEMSGLGVDTRSDIYALGVLLYELLTGETPFDAKELVESGLDQMRRTIRENEPLRPSAKLSRKLGATERSAAGRLKPDIQAVAAIKGDLDWIVMKCLEKDRNRRYETANGLSRDIQLHLKNEPVSAAAPTATYKLGKFVRRNYKMLLPAGIIVILLVIGLATSVALMIWALTAERVGAKAGDDLAVANKNLRRQLLETEKQRDRADAENLFAQRNLYFGDMLHARRAWEQDNLTLGRQLLEATAAYPKRGFEWFYWKRKMHPELRIFKVDAAGIGIRTTAVSSDGQRVVTGDYDGTITIWQAASGSKLLEFKGHTGMISSAVFSLDGRQILTGGHDETAKLWDAVTGVEILSFTGHTEAVYSVAFSPSGDQVLTASHDDTARVWALPSGNQLRALQVGPVVNARFSADGKKIATAGPVGVRLWDAASGQEVAGFTPQIGPIGVLSFSPDGEQLAVGGADGIAKVLNATDGSVALTFTAHPQPITAIAFSPDGQRIVTGDTYRFVIVWEASSGRQLFHAKGHGAVVTSVAFFPDGQSILSAGDSTARIWPADSRGDDLTLKGHKHWVYSVAFSADNRMVASASADSTAILWDAHTGALRRIFRGHVGEVGAVAFLPDGHRMITIGADATARIWEVASGKELFTFRGHSAPIDLMRVSADGQRVLTWSQDRVAKIWRPDTGSELFTLKGLHPHLGFSSDGQRIVGAGLDGVTKVWEVSSGRQILSLPGRSGAGAFSPDGKRIVTAGAHDTFDNTAKVWDGETGAELLTLTGHTGSINSVAFSPDGERIITASYDKTSRVWEVESGRELLTLAGHSAAVTRGIFSPDGRQIATSSFDWTIKIWRTASPDQIAQWNKAE